MHTLDHTHVIIPLAHVIIPLAHVIIPLAHVTCPHHPPMSLAQAFGLPACCFPLLWSVL